MSYNNNCTGSGEDFEALLSELPEAMQAVLRMQIASSAETYRTPASRATLKGFRYWYNVIGAECLLLFIGYAVVVSLYNPHDLNWLGTLVTW